MSQSMVMVVESDRFQRLLLTEEFEHEGYDVVAVPGGEEALEAMAERRPDAVVLEVRLPGMDGLALMERLVAIDERLPVVIHTATDGLQDHVLAWAADAYLLKHSDLGELTATVGSLVATRGRRRGASRALRPAPSMATA